MADVPIYNHSPPEGINLHTQTHEDIVNSNINISVNLYQLPILTKFQLTHL